MAEEPELKPSRLTFDYIKSPSFRVIHADGAIGGVTPRGDIHVAYFSEREAIPTRMVFEMLQGGTLGRELDEERITRGGFVREMDVDVVMSVTVAESLMKWLSEQISIAKVHLQKKDARK